jgi:hypothetical protein
MKEITDIIPVFGNFCVFLPKSENQGDRFLNETMKWISLQKPVPLILCGG